MDIFIRTEILSLEKSRELYNSLRNFVLNSEGHKYNSESYLEGKDFSVSEEDKNEFTYERCEFKYKNIDGKNITIRAYKGHQYLNGAKYGLCSEASYQATIYAERENNYGNNGEYILWSVSFSDIPYECYGRATSSELPLDSIMPADMNEERLNELMKEKVKKNEQY